ncbi:hypothetical protein E2C01_060103 [Portunus trituberculatus]|uniref:Uncharacterized protein n=1 Tax=Portunus trituberculatus TaxID=210409 RepID=A0A5B7H4D4_PORTR|nr:hypothetical protein [Portunus trituberculatus]
MSEEECAEDAQESGDGQGVQEKQDRRERKQTGKHCFSRTACRHRDLDCQRTYNKHLYPGRHHTRALCVHLSY